MTNVSVGAREVGDGIPEVGPRDGARGEQGRRWHAGSGWPCVLIVDDVADNLFALEAMLKRADIEILTARSGRAALEILLAREVAVAIVDVQMPEMDGFELASLMRGVERTRLVPIIFVTAGSRDQARVFRGYEAGAVDYLFKPIDEAVLRGKVDVFVTLERHRQELREAERMREMFIAVLGHDLRNPLSAIQMATELLLEGEATSEPLQRILRNGKRMSRMIEQLLDATRFRTDGSVSLSPELADLRVLTEEILGELEHARARFRLEACGDTEGTWDVDRLLQILSNLISNATNHSPSGSPVTISIDGRDRDTVELWVHNGGPPIPEPLRGVLFEPFRRSDRQRRGQEGLGLGLYITKRLVEAHRGTIAVDSREGKGTRFVVRLPRHVPLSRVTP